jgi:DNA-binding transcriptional MocR family regulator
MESHTCLYKRLAQDIQSQIGRGDFLPGEKLPSLRTLKGKLGLGLNTVYQAYVELETLGLVEARAKSGFFVKAKPLIERAAPRFDRTTAAPGKVRPAELTNTVVENALNPSLVPLGASMLSPELLPAKHLARIIRSIASSEAASLLNYSPSDGMPQLRRKLANRLLGMVPNIRSRQVVVTNGCTEAVALALMAITRRGDVVAVESPTHFGFLQLLREMGLLVLELPTDPVCGLVLRGLKKTLLENKVKALLLMPNFHNPLGALMSDLRKKKLVAILKGARIPVIEDDIYAELFFGDRRPKIIKHWDRQDAVITCSSFSKILAPGFRVGWVVAGHEIADRIRRLKASFSLAPPTLQQVALTRFLSRGALDRHLRLLRANVHKQLLMIAMAVQRAFPSACRLVVPKGGNMLWVELPPGIDGTRLYQKALKKGISIVPGNAFSNGNRFRNYIRISCTSPFCDRIAGAIEELGKMLRSSVG